MAKPQWDAFLMEEMPEEIPWSPWGPRSSWWSWWTWCSPGPGRPGWASWPAWPRWPGSPSVQVQQPGLLAALSLFAVVVVLALYLGMDRLRVRVEHTLRGTRHLLATLKERLADGHLDPGIRKMIHDLRRTEKEYAECLKKCDQMPGQRQRLQALGSGDVGSMTTFTDISEPDFSLTPSEGELTDYSVGPLERDSNPRTHQANKVQSRTPQPPVSKAPELIPILCDQALRNVAVEQGDWFRKANHGMCLDLVDDSSSDDSDATLEPSPQTSPRWNEDDIYWQQLYEENKAYRKRPR